MGTVLDCHEITVGLSARGKYLR